MSDSRIHSPRIDRPRRHGRLSARILAKAAGAASLLALAFSAAALAGSAPLVGTAHNAHLRATILVDAQGRTLYVLSGESTHHLLCTSHACLAAWPPLTVSHSSRLSLGAGAHGHLGTLRRGSTEQVTLNGMPLYLFVGDHGKGEANGEGIASFGGTWHAVLSSGRSR